MDQTEALFEAIQILDIAEREALPGGNRYAARQAAQTALRLAGSPTTEEPIHREIRQRANRLIQAASPALPMRM